MISEAMKRYKAMTLGQRISNHLEASQSAAVEMEEIVHGLPDCEWKAEALSTIGNLISRIANVRADFSENLPKAMKP